MQQAANGTSRFAAKEAVFKAHPWWRLGFHDIIIRTRGPAIVSDTKDGCPVYDNAGDSVASLLSDISSDAFSGRPVAIIKPPRLATGNGVASTARSEPSPDHDGEGQEALLSISHDGCYATAVCLAWDHGAGVGRR